MDINNMFYNDFMELPLKPWGKDMGTFDSLIILPIKVRTINMIIYNIKRLFAKLFGFKEPDIWEISGIHDSGYRCMDFVASKGNKPICRLSGCSDVIHFDGIGGYGYNWLEKHGTVPKLVVPSGWTIDCLLNSGLLRVFCNGEIKATNRALSSFEIYQIERKKQFDIFHRRNNGH
jgi:hypothetical protein